MFDGAEQTMTKRARRKIDAALKAKIALEAMREQASVNEVRSTIRFTPIRFTVAEAAAG